MKTETNLDLVELSHWLLDATETVNSPQAALRQGTLNGAHAARVKFLIEEIWRLHRIIGCIGVIACSEQGYGDIEELCESAVGEQRLLGLMHDAVLSKMCSRCQKANFDCECGEEES